MRVWILVDALNNVKHIFLGGISSPQHACVYNYFMSLDQDRRSKCAERDLADLQTHQAVKRLHQSPNAPAEAASGHPPVKSDPDHVTIPKETGNFSFATTLTLDVLIINTLHICDIIINTIITFGFSCH